MLAKRFFHSLTGRSRRRQALAGLLVLALLLAQWSGFQHRIAHSGFGLAASTVAAGGGPRIGSGGDSLHHSCLAFDAATLAVALHAAVPSAPALPSRLPAPQRPTFASWDAPFVPHFLTRAPPAA
ncbi:MAG: hypothetical protein WBG17_04660 [Burkholderiaceae bacterium]